MDKKYLIVIVIAVLIIICSVFYVNYSNSHTAQIGEINFNIPSEFEVSGFNNDGDLTIINGNDSVYLTVYDNNGTAKQMSEDYRNEREQNNRTISISTFTINNILVYKSDSSAGANHYWFDYHEKTYSIYTWQETSNIDNIVRELISESVHN